MNINLPNDTPITVTLKLNQWRLVDLALNAFAAKLVDDRLAETCTVSEFMERNAAIQEIRDEVHLAAGRVATSRTA